MLRNKFIIFACMLMAGFNANALSASDAQNAMVEVTGWNSGGNANNVNLVTKTLFFVTSPWLFKQNMLSLQQNYVTWYKI